MAEKTSGIRFKDKIGYALGDAGGTLTFGIIGSFLQMFYTDVLYITPAAVSRMYTAAAAIPAASCLLMALFLGVLYTLNRDKVRELYGNG